MYCSLNKLYKLIQVSLRPKTPFFFFFFCRINMNPTSFHELFLNIWSENKHADTLHKHHNTNFSRKKHITNVGIKTLTRNKFSFTILILKRRNSSNSMICRWSTYSKSSDKNGGKLKSWLAANWKIQAHLLEKLFCGGFERILLFQEHVYRVWKEQRTKQAKKTLTEENVCKIVCAIQDWSETRIGSHENNKLKPLEHP